MEKRNRDRLVMTAFCRVAPAGNKRKTSWKRIENISGAGMLVNWSNGESDSKSPKVGDAYTVELQLPPHPVFGQRALMFQTKVVRVSQQSNGNVKVGLQSAHGRFRPIRAGSWPESAGTLSIN